MSAKNPAETLARHGLTVARVDQWPRLRVYRDGDEIGAFEVTQLHDLARVVDAAASTETITLADGPAEQALVPGVAPGALVARQVAAERGRREARRDHQPMRAGGLFDQVARDQLELFA